MLAVMRDVDVPIMLLKKEFVPSMVHHGQKSIAVMKDVLIMLLREEYVSDTVLKLRLAALKDVTIR